MADRSSFNAPGGYAHDLAPKPFGYAHDFDVEDGRVSPISQDDHDENPLTKHMRFSTLSTDEKKGEGDVEKGPRPISKVPANPNYYEKDGLRTYGDAMDHVTEPTMTFTRWMALTAMSFLWSASQIPLYFFGGTIALVYGDIGGSDIYVWAVIGNLIALGAVTPFVGALSDLFGRRWTGAGGMVSILIGCIICSVAGNMHVFIVGMVFAGIGGGVCELTALAATGELVPTAQRGLYVGGVILSILPFAPAVLWAQLIGQYSWRYNGLLCGLWTFIGLILLLVFYHPPPRVNILGLSRMEVFKRIDFIGGFLSIGGIVSFLLALTWGGNAYPWGSAHVIVPLVFGVLGMAAFVVYEQFFAKWPMFPGRLKRDPRALYLIVFITFISGGNFFAVLLFWPVQSYSIFGIDPVQVGLRSLPIGFGILLGAVIVAFLVTLLNGRIRFLLVASCVIMTLGTGTMSFTELGHLGRVWVPLCLAALGVGGVIIPNQVIITIVCPDDLIATATALALTVRVLGGAIGYAIFYNVFRTQYVNNAVTTIGVTAINNGIVDYDEIVAIATTLSAMDLNQLAHYPGVNTQAIFDALVESARYCFSESFPIVWKASVAFGGLATLAALGLPDIATYMDQHVAVQYN